MSGSIKKTPLKNSAFNTVESVGEFLEKADKIDACAKWFQEVVGVGRVVFEFFETTVETAEKAKDFHEYVAIAAGFSELAGAFRTFGGLFLSPMAAKRAMEAGKECFDESKPLSKRVEKGFTCSGEIFMVMLFCVIQPMLVITSGVGKVRGGQWVRIAKITKKILSIGLLASDSLKCIANALKCTINRKQARALRKGGIEDQSEENLNQAKLVESLAKVILGSFRLGFPNHSRYFVVLGLVVASMGIGVKVQGHLHERRIRKAPKN